jgi:hypothetical protein
MQHRFACEVAIDEALRTDLAATISAASNARPMPPR